MVISNKTVTSGESLVRSEGMEVIQRKSGAARLEKPMRITEQVWPEGTVPVVSIFCITYNHEKFIRDAIEGFLMQETTFPVEIFIHDDASTDSTADIVREYQTRYPQFFWTVLQKENQWSKEEGYILKFLKKQRGTFVAFCEGDDYWIDPKKLQLQVDYLLSNHNVRLVCTQYFHRSGNYVERPSIQFNQNVTRDNWARPYSLKTATAVFCLRDLLDCGVDIETIKNVKDIVLWRLLLQKGEARVLPSATAVYRLHDKGVWSQKSMFSKAFSNLQSAESMLVCLGREHPDIAEFYAGSLASCLEHLADAESEVAWRLTCIALAEDIMYLPMVFKSWIKRFVYSIKRASLAYIRPSS